MHTPASADWLEPGVTYLEWLQKAESKGLDIVAITDHNTVEGVARLRDEIERLTWLEANDRLRPQERRDLDEYRRIGDKILVLPGFEFTAMFGFHILAIFPPETTLRKLEMLLLRLNVPEARIAEGSTEVGASTDVLTAYRLIHEAGGLVIAAHANSTHGVALQGLSFGGQTKIAFTQDPNLHALEVTDLESASRRATARFFDGSKPEYPRRMHCIQGSDAHRLVRDPKDKNRLGIGDRVTEVLLPEVSFEALKAVFEGDDFARTRPYRPPAETPFDHVEAAREQGNTIVQAFHESMSREGGRLHKILCDVVAFANTSGGTVYIGVSATRKTPARGVENPEATVTLLRKELERNITPQLDARADVVQSLGVPIVRILVPNGPDKPYALGQTRIYVRQEGETNEAVRDELVQLVLAGRELAAPVQPAAAVPAGPAPAQPTMPATEAAPQVMLPAEQRPGGQPESMPAPTAPPAEGLPLPAVGVEIVAMEERKGSRYFTIRDLRNNNVVQNVTMQSARKLWSYAISQYLTNPFDPAEVTWRGDFGLWQAARRAKKMRYDLVLRQPDGALRIFYGVTADGMSGPWAQFLQAEDRGEGESAIGFIHEPEHAPEQQAEWEAAQAALVEPEPVAEAGRTEEVEPGQVAEPGVLLTEPAIPAAAEKPAPKRRSRRSHGKAKGEAEVTNKTEVTAEVQPEAAPAAAPEGAIPVETESALPAEVAAPQVEAKPKPRSSRPRARKAPAAVEAATPAAEAIPPAESTPAPTAEPKPRTRSRSRKPQTSEPVNGDA